MASAKFMSERIPVAVLGASGLVGQRFQQRLVNHPWFRLAVVVGSEESAGKQLSELVWRLDEKRPNLPNITVISGEITGIINQLEKTNIQLVFSALPSAPASIIEQQLADAGFHIFSNASAHREQPGIPLVIADLNPEHLAHFGSHKSTLKNQHSAAKTDGVEVAGSIGSITCSTNCTVVPIALPLKALSQISKIIKVEIKSQQALSGGGWKLLSDESSVNGNPNPFIPGEEEKVISELKHLLGVIDEQAIIPADIEVTAECVRVGERDGHFVEVSVHFENVISVSDAEKAISQWTCFPENNLPSAPKSIMQICREIPNRVEHLWLGQENNLSEELDPSKDLRAGMAIMVGGISSSEEKVIKFSALSHNTIRGAAGGCVLLAELVYSRGLIV
jgi:aspartate-semialdehyde dehydrogenase